MTSNVAERLERKRKQDREAQARRRRLVNEGKAWFSFPLDPDLVASALIVTGRDRGSELFSHEECEDRLRIWVNEILNAAVMADLPKRCGPDDSVRSNRGLRPK
jgi:hypothetical protein